MRPMQGRLMLLPSRPDLHIFAANLSKDSQFEAGDELVARKLAGEETRSHEQLSALLG